MPTALRLPSSLWARLLLASLVLLPLFLLASGYLLDRSFSESQHTAHQAQLQSQAYLLMAAAEWDGETIWLPEALQEPGFNQPDSGLYGFIIGRGREIWRSPSARFQLRQWRPRDNTVIRPGQTGLEYQTLPATDTTPTIEVAVFYYDILWDTGGETPNLPLRFYVVLDLTQSLKELQIYRQQLGYSLGALVLTLLLLQLLIVRWGLRPLREVTQELHAIQHSQKEVLEGIYPQEIEPITQSFNQVLLNEQRQRERYRTTLGDLAHSLKTPLAVLQGELQNLPAGDTRDTLSEQCTRMNQIIQHQLRRAVAGQQNTFAEQTEVTKLVSRLCGALDKVYKDKNIQFSQDIAAESHFYGASSDLMEVMGNLLDNACKFCDHQILVSATWKKGLLTITVDADGPCLPPERQQELLQRGARADTAYAGQGIGLAVAIDIISSYRGALAVEQAPLGGARFRITFEQPQ